MSKREPEAACMSDEVTPQTSNADSLPDNASNPIKRIKMSKREPEAACMSDEVTPQTSNADSLPDNASNPIKRNTTPEQEEEYEHQSTQTDRILTIIKNSVPSSTIHGELYSTHLAISIILHQFKKQNKFIVATEVSKAGKFDDILYHYESPQATSTLCIQAKHRKNSGSCITIHSLCVAKGEFSIPMYFSSFLDIDQKLTADELKNQKTRYAICTNAKLHKDASIYFKEIDPQEDDSLEFCEAIGAKCYQLSGDIPGLTGKLRESCKDKLTGSKFDEQKDLFFNKFLLICNSMNKNSLRKQAVKLLPKWCDEAQRKTVLDKLEALLNNEIDSNPRYYMDLERMQKCMLEIELNQNISDLNRSSREYRELVHEKRSHIEVNPERLKGSKLYQFLENKSDCGIYEFNSSLDLTVSSRILVQALSLLQYETIFVDSTKFATHQHMLNTLDNLLSYLKDVNHPTIKMITIVGKHGHRSVDEIKELSEKYSRKIVVVEKMAVSFQNDETFEKIQVKDLSDEALKQLYTQNEGMMFGTNTRLSSIVDETDDLSLLLDVLDDQPREMVDRNLNEQNYEKIKHWYIERRYVKYDQMLNDNNVADLEYSDMSDEEDQSKSSTSDEESDPSVFQDNDSGKVCIFLNDAGLGKTTFFTWLAWRLSTSDRSRHVIKFNAVDYSTDFGKLKCSDLQNHKEIEIVRLLYRYIHLALFVPSMNKLSVKETDKDRRNADRCSNLLTLDIGKGEIELEKTNDLSTEELIELRLFQKKFNSRNLILILDGFDEIAPIYKDVVMKCFARFVELAGVRSLYLSSRPYGFKEELKKTFHQGQMYRLEPFSKADILRSFNKFLLNNLDGYKDYEEQHRNDILYKLFNIFSDVFKNMITVPLLLYMVQIILLPEIKNRVHINGHTISDQMLNDTKIDILHMIEKFIDRKIQILNTDKSGTTDSAGATAVSKKNEVRLEKELKEQHMLLAMYVIFDKKDREKLLSKKEQRRADKIMKEVNQGDEKTGIVLGVQNGVPQFLHRTFAEYYSACWLFANWKRFKSERFFHSQTFWSRSMRQTRDFFNRLVLRKSEGCDLHLAVVNRSYEKTEELLRFNPSAVTVKDKVGRLPLHLVEYFKEDSLDDERTYPDIESILAEMSRKLRNEKDSLCGWNALDYAFVLNKEDLIKVLFESGVKPNMYKLCQQVCSNDVRVLLWKGSNYDSIFDHSLKQTDLAEELSERVAKFLIEKEQLDIYAPLAELDSLSVLEEVATEDYFHLFRPLITKSDPQALAVDDRGNILLRISLDKRAYKFVNCLVEYHPSLISMINGREDLFYWAKSAIEKNQMELFKTIFGQICITQNIDCDTEDNIIVELANQHESETFEIEIPFENDCCIKLWNVDLDPTTEGLLSVVLNCGNTQLVSYIVQKTKMVITVELIGTIMQQFRRWRDKNDTHEKCMPTFKYLFSKIADLYAVDKDGLNLFLMIMKYGCVFMLHSLIAIGFDPKQNNITNHWDIIEIFLYEVQQTTANKCLYLQQRSIVDCFDSIGPKGESIFDTAIITKSFLAAQALVEDKFHNLSYSERKNAVFDLLGELLIKFEFGIIFKFVESCLEKSSITGTMWYEVYSSICHQKPSQLHLVERIIERRIEISNTDKIGATDSAGATAASKKNEVRLEKELKEQHMLLAMYVMFDKKDREKLLSKEEQRRADKIMEDVNQGVEKTGIVLGVQNGVPQFTYKRIAEYYSACWLFENWERFKSECFFHSQTFWSSSMRQTRNFFNRLVLRKSEGCDLHLAVVNRSYEKIEKLLRNNPSAVTVKDKVGRLPLHLVEYFVWNMDIKSILEKMSPELMHEEDSLCGWNALEYAFVRNEKNLIKVLFENDVKPNMDNLCQQVCSNDVGVLLWQGNNYAKIFDQCLKQTDIAEELSERVAKFLIEKEQLDIYAPLAELNSLSVLEEVAIKDYFYLFRPLITKSDPQALAVDDRGNKLLRISLDKRAHEIVNCLVEYHPSLISMINRSKDLFYCAKRAIEKNQMELFKTIFGQICITQNIDCDTEDNIIDELANQDESETFEIEIPFENDCCCELCDSAPDTTREGLLSVAIQYGNTQMVSYIVQKTKMVITVELIRTVMKHLRRWRDEIVTHKKCMPAFKYLFSKTPDLYAVDEDGLNLFLMIMKYGCVFMLPSLIAIGFDPKQNNITNDWDIIETIFYQFQQTVANKCVYLQQRSIVDCFDSIGPEGESIFDTAIKKKCFLVPQALIADNFHNLSYSERENAVLDFLNKLLQTFGKENFIKIVSKLAYKSSARAGKKNKGWYSVCNSIKKHCYNLM